MVGRSGLFLLALVLPAQVAHEPTLRITVNLIQVDAVVTDKHGQPVPNLTKEDFEILEDGKPRKVEYLSYISTPVVPAPVQRGSAERSRSAPPLLLPPTGPTRIADTRRSIAVVVDDILLSFTHTNSVRQALRKFVDEQMQPGDLVAIIRTSSGTSTLEQYTTDKRLLHAAIDRVRYHLLPSSATVTLRPVRSGSSNSEDRRDLPRRIRANASRIALRRVVDGMRQLPGRKSVLLFSPGMSMRDDPATAGTDFWWLGSVRALADLANRAGVVFYTFDALRLETYTLRAQDDVTGLPSGPSGGMALGAMQHARYAGALKVALNRDGLAYLAQETGGLFFRDDNDLAGAARQALNDQSGYYLLGYRPGEDAFVSRDGRPQFHQLKVVVKPAGLRVRSRTGYLGVPDRETPPLGSDPASRMLAALRSPFAAGDIGVHLTGLFGNAADSGSYIQAMLHIDASDLGFADDGADGKKTEIHVVLVAVGEDGASTVTNARCFQIRVPARELAHVGKHGFLYRLVCPVKKSGAYQLRAAVLDISSGKMGSASQLVEIPDVSNGRMALSGILVESTAAGAAGGAAMRVFPQGNSLVYGLVVYNPRLAGTKVSQVDLDTRVFRDGRLVWTAPPVALDSSSSPDITRVQFRGRLDVGPALPPGEYLLQVSAIDKLAPKKSEPVVQWMDFELVPAK